MTLKNMKRHCKSKHDIDTSYSAVCCDIHLGIYMVKKSEHGGVGVETSIAARSGMRERECSHLLLVNRAYFTYNVLLDDAILNELSAYRKQKSLKYDTVNK